MRRPNLVFILADQLRRQSCGYAGESRARTPNIDLLAKSGMDFRNAVSGDPLCGPYRASLMTGKYPSSTGMVINEMRMNLGHECIGHLLTRADYDTAYIGKWHLWANVTDGGEEFRHGFVPEGPPRMGFDGYWAAYNFNHHYYDAHYFRGDGEKLVSHGFEADFSTDLALQWLAKGRRRDAPFALFLSFGPPHDPWEWDNVPAQFAAFFRESEFPLPRNYADGTAEYWEPQMDRDWWLATVKKNLPKWQAVYSAMVANLDWNLGRLTAALEEQDAAETTVLVFTSDHGEMFGAHGRIAKNIFFEEAVRIPFLVRWPGKIARGSTTDICLNTPDIMPTLAGLLQLDEPAKAEGMDLSAHGLGAHGDEPSEALLQGMGHTWLWEDGFEWRGVRDKRFTYAVYRADCSEVLYDNLADPLQMHNLAFENNYGRDLSRLRDRLAVRMAELADDFQACSWYGEHWVKDRIVQKGAKG